MAKMTWPRDAKAKKYAEVKQIMTDTGDEKTIGKISKDELKLGLTIDGIELDPVKGGSTSATATVLAAGPAGQLRKREASPGWYSVNGQNVEAGAGKRWVWGWNNTAWTLWDMGDLPLAETEDNLSSIDATKALAANQGRVLNSKVLLAQQNSIQDEYISQYRKYPVTNWNAALLQRDIETSVFGKKVLATEITVPTTGNLNEFLLRFTGTGTTTDQIPGFYEGCRVNINFIIWVPQDCTPIFSLQQSPTGSPNSIEILSDAKWKSGVNKVIISLVLDADRQQGCYLRTGLVAGTKYYIKNTPVSYVGYAVSDVSTFDGFVSKETGKQLSSNDYTVEDKQKVSSLSTKVVYSNQSTLLNFASVTGGLVRNNLAGGGMRLTKNAGQGSGWAGVNLTLDAQHAWKKDHNYFVALELTVIQNSLTESSGSATGNNVFLSLAKDNATSRNISAGANFSSATTGTKTVVSTQLLINDVNNNLTVNSRWNFIQFGNFTSEQTMVVEIHKMFIVDLTASGLTKSQMDAYVAANGVALDSLMLFDFQVARALQADKAKVAETIESLNVGGDIEIWGDSLVAQQWGAILATLLGRGVVSKGFGGKKSTYIRDQFLANVNKSKTQILCLGRNNFQETDIVIDDIRAMVNEFGKPNFLILMPPNGHYGTFGNGSNGTGEMKGGTQYGKFIELSEKLANEYGANFLDSRKGTIYSYKMSRKLTAAFTKPAVGSQVTIAVDDADFLTNYNTSDVERFGDTFMRQIRIGINGAYDLYRVITKNSSTSLTIELVQSNYLSVGASIGNLTDDGGTNSVKYLRVMQEADYQCYMHETTQSTFRSDGVHMSELGKACIAKIVANKVVSMKI